MYLYATCTITNQDLTACSVDNFRFADEPRRVLAHNGRLSIVPNDVSALSEARFRKSVKSGEVLCARSIEPFEGGRWRLRWMRANGWSRSNGYGN